MSKSFWKPDPATRAVLDMAAASDLPPMSTLTPVEARKTVLERRKITDMDPLPVAHVVNRAIPGPVGPLAIRCYYPEPAPAEGLPALLYFHGGGFVICDIDTHDTICRCLCRASGAIVMSVEYRLAPEHRYPAAVEDAIVAFDWLAANTKEIGGDPNRLAVGGDSAGGTLAAVVAQHARDAGAAGLLAQALLYPAVDQGGDYASRIENEARFPIPRDVLDWFWHHYFGPDSPRLEPWASPARHDAFEGLAPAFVLTAGLDPLRDEGAAYADRLAAAGVETVYQCFMGTIHGFLSMGRLIPAAHEALASAGSFVKARLAVDPGGASAN